MHKINVGILFLLCLSAGALCAADTRAGTRYLVTDESQVPEGDEVWETNGKMYGYKPLDLQKPVYNGVQQKMQRYANEAYNKYAPTSTNWPKKQLRSQSSDQGQLFQTDPYKPYTPGSLLRDVVTEEKRKLEKAQQ